MRFRQKATAAAIIAIAAAVCVYYYFVDPAAAGAAPRCVLRAATGYDCPGCGTQRALHALLHGRLSEAWNFNPAAFVAVPLAAAYAVAEAVPGRFARIERLLYRPAFIMAIAAAVTAWWILRNAL
ncbi:MAG: DUF2752 domain-containing protein [Muribaculaceae bacterium]|nr:DUF2752 domain-containing protein [Muribaculaceae bacterium]